MPDRRAPSFIIRRRVNSMARMTARLHDSAGTLPGVASATHFPKNDDIVVLAAGVLAAVHNYHVS